MTTTSVSCSPSQEHCSAWFYLPYTLIHNLQTNQNLMTPFKILQNHYLTYISKPKNTLHNVHKSLSHSEKVSRERFIWWKYYTTFQERQSYLHCALFPKTKWSIASFPISQIGHYHSYLHVLLFVSLQLELQDLVRDTLSVMKHKGQHNLKAHMF